MLFRAYGARFSGGRAPLPKSEDGSHADALGRDDQFRQSLNDLHGLQADRNYLPGLAARCIPDRHRDSDRSQCRCAYWSTPYPWNCIDQPFNYVDLVKTWYPY
jgi:hypothetical protein